MARWSSPKDPALEAALRRNRRWIVNNQIKRLLLRFPSRSAPVRLLQSRFKTLDLLGRAGNWPGEERRELWFGFDKRTAELGGDQEASAVASDPAMADRLARRRRLQVSKLAALRAPLGLPDDYLPRVLSDRADLFRRVPSLAVSAVDAAASASDSLIPSCGSPVRRTTRTRWRTSTPRLTFRPTFRTGRRLGSTPMVQKVSVMKLEHFRWEFGLPEDTVKMLLRHCARASSMCQSVQDSHGCAP